MHHQHHVRRQVDHSGYDLSNDLNVLEHGVKLIEPSVATLVSVVYVTATPTFKGPVGGYTTIVPVAPVQTSTIQSPVPVPTTAAEESTALEISSALAQSFVLPSGDASPTTSASSTNNIRISSSPLDSVQATTTPSASQPASQPVSISANASNIPPVSVVSATSTPVVTPLGSPGLSGGGKTGVAVGVILGLVALLAVAALCLLHRKKQNNKPYEPAEDEKNPFGDRAAVPAQASTPARTSTPPQLTRRDSMQPRTQREVAMSGALRNIQNLDVEKAQTAPDPAANPFGKYAEVSRVNQDIPAPLRIGTVTSDNAPACIEGGAVAGATSANTAQRHNAPKARDIKPIVTPSMRQPMDGAMPSPAFTECSMKSRSVVDAAASTSRIDVHRIQLDFKPSMEDELELKAGQLVRLLHEYDDGWALCIRLDRSQQGVAPRTCLSARPVKPRSKISENPSSGICVPVKRQDNVPRSMSPGPYAGGSQEAANSPGSETRSNSAGDDRGKRNNPPSSSLMVTKAHSSQSMQGFSASVQSVATFNDTPPKRKPVPGRSM
ncbi:hypothetical protein MMC26_007551 [Xylographa opegraphella]|nr:hypothetical protein [Xylographa opegraphella]